MAMIFRVCIGCRRCCSSLSDVEALDLAREVQMEPEIGAEIAPLVAARHRWRLSRSGSSACRCSSCAPGKAQADAEIYYAVGSTVACHHVMDSDSISLGTPAYRKLSVALLI